MKCQKNTSKWMAVIACIAFVSISQAEPNVIYDAGPEASQSMATYVNILATPKRFQLPTDSASIERLQQALTTKIQEQGGGRRFVRVPIRTPNMHPARIDSHDAYYENLISPIFIVGADANSLKWLTVWRDALQRIGAIGWVVQAEDEQDLRAIANAGHGLRMMTLSGEDIPRVFGISTYPVLISSRSIEQ